MIKIAICDDNIEELSKITSLLETYRIEQPIDYEYRTFHNSFDIISLLEKGDSFDIYCLDIIMPNFSGIELAKEIRSYDKKAQVIFLTSSSEFALESYAVKAANYILKPVTKEKLFPTLNDTLESIMEEQQHAIVVKSKDGLQKILLSKLMFVEAMGRKNLYHLFSGRIVECTSRFSSVCETLLIHNEFIQPHRSFLVNMSFIDTIEKNTLTLQAGTNIPIAQGKSKVVKEEYLAFQMMDF
ncbi:MAG: LytTR family DNA-binding domain-containing protein [Anaerostipes sp.]|nr:LytTR family DNA-binding domain-containing protein [Anaerostipes sp.]MDD3747088.1 LytTR family DNA-binding domain-containing protein [Anaerostipes sp.]